MNIFEALSEKAKPAKSVPPSSVAVQPTEPDYTKFKTPELIEEWKTTGKTEYRDELLKRMQPTINSAINSYAPGMNNRLAVKAANLTLAALRNYKGDKGTDPRTYVFHNLHRLSRYNNDASNILKEPESVQHDRRYIQDYIDKFQDRYGRDPSLAELADATGLSTKRIDNVMESTKTVSESATLSDDSQKDTFARSALTDDDYLEYVYASVDPIDQKIIEWTSGMHRKPVLSNGEIANRLHISAAAVSQRKARIQKQLSDVRGLV